MKIILFILFAGSLVTSLSSAQYAPEPDQSAPKIATTETVTGTVESISLGDPANNIKPEIVIVDEKGQKVNLEIKTNTAIYTKICTGLRSDDGGIICLANVMVGDKVSAEYMTTKSDANKVLSMTVFK